MASCNFLWAVSNPNRCFQCPVLLGYWVRTSVLYFELPDVYLKNKCDDTIAPRGTQTCYFNYPIYSNSDLIILQKWFHDLNYVCGVSSPNVNSTLVCPLYWDVYLISLKTRRQNISFDEKDCRCTSDLLLCSTKTRLSEIKFLWDESILNCV